MEDPVFRADWGRALEQGYARLEMIILERAMRGGEPIALSGDGEAPEGEPWDRDLALHLLREHKRGLAGIGKAGRRADAGEHRGGARAAVQEAQGARGAARMSRKRRREDAGTAAALAARRGAAARRRGAAAPAQARCPRRSCGRSWRNGRGRRIAAKSEPKGDWRVWLLMAGRGFGKTRAGAEWVSARARADKGAKIALVGATLEDVRKVMIEGNSGLIAVARTGEAVAWSPTLGVATFSSGAQAFAYSAAAPLKLRGPEHHFAWCDEIAKWAYPDATWDNLMLGLRVGERPRVVVTTTPRPMPLLHADHGDWSGPSVTGGRHDDNVHLSADFLAAVRGMYHGTRLGRQELDGELFDDVENALWPRALIEKCRSKPVAREDLARVVVAVDPPASESGDACGIVVAGLGTDGRGYVLADASVDGMSPEGWAAAVARAAEAWAADRVVAEGNNGGAMVASVLRAAEHALPLRIVHASIGKVARAEPVAALFESGRAWFAGVFPELEDELAGLVQGGGYQGPTRSPDRADACVWALTELMLGKSEEAAGAGAIGPPHAVGQFWAIRSGGAFGFGARLGQAGLDEIAHIGAVDVLQFVIDLAGLGGLLELHQGLAEKIEAVGGAVALRVGLVIAQEDLGGGGGLAAVEIGAAGEILRVARARMLGIFLDHRVERGLRAGEIAAVPHPEAGEISGLARIGGGGVGGGLERGRARSRPPRRTALGVEEAAGAPPCSTALRRNSASARNLARPSSSWRSLNAFSSDWPVRRASCASSASTRAFRSATGLVAGAPNGSARSTCGTISGWTCAAGPPGKTLRWTARICCSSVWTRRSTGTGCAAAGTAAPAIKRAAIG